MEFFLKQLLINFDKFSHHLAFFIEEEEFSYSDLKQRVAVIQQKIFESGNQQYFGVVTRNTIDTFASIFALWLSGKTMVPIGTKIPLQRNEYILERTGIKIIFDSHTEGVQFPGTHTVLTSELPNSSTDPLLIDVSPDTDLYLLFTSGSTGFPKGVRITQKNFHSYLEAFFGCGYQISPSDRCIEVFDLTFDASVQCYTFPLMKGASVFTIPGSGIRFLSILKILQEQNITFIKMTPSTIFYLQPYFSSIRLPHLRYCLFGAEAFPAALVKKWENCIPNAEIHNVYGPTECTINCCWYPWKRNSENKIRNGIAAIGKPYSQTTAIICNGQQQEVTVGTAGELCISGPQVTPGYRADAAQDKRAFFFRQTGKGVIRFYRTGDLAVSDDEGDIYYIGRIDSQVQIDGHRVEMGEIENHAHTFTKSKCVAVVRNLPDQVPFICLFVESDYPNEEELVLYLRKQIPEYMLPRKIIFIPQIPLLVSGKTDRQKLLTLI